MDQGPSEARGFVAIVGGAIDRYTPLLWLILAFAAIGAAAALHAPGIQPLVGAIVIGVIAILAITWLFEQLRRRAWGEIGYAAVGVGVLAAVCVAGLGVILLLAGWLY